MNILRLLLLLPFTLLYLAIISLRNFFYDVNLFPANKVDAFVISVGNISVGGTGKTPFVIWLSEFLANENRNIGILTRGYRRTGSKPRLFTRTSQISDWRESGDEPFLLHKRLNDVTIAVDSNRYRGALTAISTDNCDTLILDDGFQHRMLRRDIDIVLINESTSLNDRLLIPAGKLREPMGSLKRADVVIVMSDRSDPDLSQYYTNWDIVVCGGSKKPTKLVNPISGDERSLDKLNNLNINAFCGIGDPKSFSTFLYSALPKSMNLIEFPDHHEYSNSDLRSIKEKYRSSGADILITTEKDHLKLPPNFFEDLSVYILRIEFTMTWGTEELEKLLRQNY